MSICIHRLAAGVRTHSRANANKRLLCRSPRRRAQGRTPSLVIPTASPAEVRDSVAGNGPPSRGRDELLESLERLFPEQVCRSFQPFQYVTDTCVAPSFKVAMNPSCAVDAYAARRGRSV